MPRVKEIEASKTRLLEEIEEVGDDDEFDPVKDTKPVTFDRVVSTGSTLLDLAISGERIRGGGIPGGLLVEIFGEEATGKSALIAEIMSSAQHKSPPGLSKLADPEGRFGAEYARIYDVDMMPGYYHRVRTVIGAFNLLADFLEEVAPKNRAGERVPNGGLGLSVFGCDSLAALSTDTELEDEDKRGQQRAKDFSGMLRKYHAEIANSEIGLMVASNQMRESDTGLETPGGRAVRFYSSLRIRLKRAYPSWQFKRERKLESGKDESEVAGVISTAQVVKSSVSAPFRDAPVYIEFGYGVDDIRANLQWRKGMMKDRVYGIDKQTSAQALDQAIRKVEENGRAEDLREEVIDLWAEIREQFKVERQPKERR